MNPTRRIIALVLVSVLVAVSASACLSSANNTPTSSGGITLAAEPTGGSWKPFVLNASDAIRSVPPPAQGSSPFTQEVTELKALQANRTPAVNESIAYWNNGSVVRWNEIAQHAIQ